MPSTLICPKHGQYLASLGSCPVCSGKSKSRPGAPSPLKDDDLETDARPSSVYRASRIVNDDDPTVIPDRHRRVVDEEDDPTIVVRGKGRNIDETEPYGDAKPKECEAILWVKDGDRRGKIYKIKNDTEIGRENCSIELDDSKVSSRHAKIVLRNDQYIIGDFVTTNGTFINGERITGETILKENDLIKIGETTFVFKVLQ
jgi:hypothetical protein